MGNNLFAGAFGLLSLSLAQILVWQETFDDPGAVGRWNFGPTPPGLPLSYSLNSPAHNYFVINDANTPELDAAGNFIRGRRAECAPPNNLPNPYTNGGPVNLSLHITARATSDGAVLGYVNFPDYGDEYSWSNQGFGEDANTEQTAFLTQNISTMGRTCLRLVADFYLGGDRDRLRSYASLLYSTDGGNTWKVAVPNIQQTIPTVVWLAYHFAAGTCNNWIRLTFNLPADAENIPNLRIAFRWRNENSSPMTTADYTLSAGFNVDNIRIEAAAPPTADFVANATVVCKNQPVSFTNLTQIPCNLPTTYTWQISPPGGWSFTGGTNANSPNPQITFTANGSYTIQLTANNAAGHDIEIKTAYIQVQDCPPQAAFSTSTNVVCALNPHPPGGSPTQMTL
ncbi:MAG: PKD domain-containing protein, partial [Bacteroidia bacterium]|nr:PKD domain-containing protein [Bacteroidia bacterium]MDW8134986.1 PKD domain-containing protein [Bacteroidia bacterium]